jgi:hypothetical protein
MNRNVAAAILVMLGLMLLVAVIGIPLFFINTMQRTTDRVLAPVEQANQRLQTQVSDLLNPTPTLIPDPVTIINEVRALARLETIQYTVEKVITAEIGQDRFRFLFGDRLLFVARGEVIAGIDLGRLTADDLTLSGERLRVRLPEPEIFVATLDNHRSYVYDRDTGVLRREVTDLETLARQMAQEEILNAALEDGILDTARVNAENFLDGFFGYLGYDQVIFEYYEVDTGE